MAVLRTTPRVPRLRLALRCAALVHARVRASRSEDEEEGARGRERSPREKSFPRTIGMLIRFARFLGFFVLFCECRSSADDLVECVPRLVEASVSMQPRPKGLLWTFIGSRAPVRSVDSARRSGARSFVPDYSKGRYASGSRKASNVSFISVNRSRPAERTRADIPFKMRP